ncbi:hypothetical protein [Streptomyces colonosanans]|uniref:Uncharacterized protein n=1 Tax=Streptomyces colonosanans TaxID=1428652 RepID=A0A1S2Q371_9ACTN|nr:hypothetical protein [Streptomyces colonosanans]OIK00026.1 hypothetical protein BIV24_03105 [Streptomyces colonosanans]
MDWVDLSLLRRGSRVHFLLAWALCVLALLLAAATWLPGPNGVPFGAVGFLFIAIFPVVGAALLLALFSEGGRAMGGLVVLVAAAPEVTLRGTTGAGSGSRSGRAARPPA